MVVDRTVADSGLDLSNLIFFRHLSHRSLQGPSLDALPPAERESPNQINKHFSENRVIPALNRKERAIIN